MVGLSLLSWPLPSALAFPPPLPSPPLWFCPMRRWQGEGHSAALKSGHPGILVKCIWEWSGPWIVLIQEPSPALLCPLPRDRNRQEGLGSTHHLVQRAAENRHEESQLDSHAVPPKILLGAVATA